MRRVLLLIAIVCCLPTAAYAQCDKHGSARWPVKTSAISTASNAATILTPDAFVNAPDLDIPASAVPDDRFIAQDATIGDKVVREGQLVEITGFVSDVRCEENDGDYHGDFRADGSGAGPCAEVEVPFPGNVAGPATNARVAEARQAFDQWVGQKTTVHVTLIGQLFYDSTHHSSTDPGGGRGAGHCAATLWEIHPVLKVFVR